jgi:hypothetical protein
MNKQTLITEELAKLGITEDVIRKIEESITNKLEEVKGQHQYDIARVTEEYEKAIIDLEEEHDLEKEELKEQAQKYGDYTAKEAEKKFKRQLQESQSKLVDRLDSYANYVVESFIEQNKKQLVERKEYEIMKDTFDRVRKLFAEQNLMFDNDSRGYILRLENELDRRKEKYNELFNELQELHDMYHEMEKERIFEDVTQTLSEAQKIRLGGLLEGTTFDNLDQYKKAVSAFTDEITRSKVQSTPIVESLNESSRYTSTSISNTPTRTDFSDKMSRYLENL